MAPSTFHPAGSLQWKYDSSFFEGRRKFPAEIGRFYRRAVLIRSGSSGDFGGSGDVFEIKVDKEKERRMYYNHSG